MNAPSQTPRAGQRDDDVRALYERFPYPPPLDDLQPFIDGAKIPAWNPRDSFALFFPEEAPRADLDILIAGCGTRIAPLMAARLPQAHIVAVDVSEASIAVSRAQCERFGLHNVELHQLRLEDVARLGETFDVINCHGVLHHLADPAAGLRALAGVLRPGGAISAMVYARYGRTGVYLLQELARRLSMSPTRDDARAMQALLTRLGDHHPLACMPWGERPRLPLEEVADLLLHPRDRAYDVAAVHELVRDAGLELHAWLGKAVYDPDLSALADLGLTERLRDSDRWERAAATELFHGRLYMHEMLLTHPERPTAQALFAGDALVDAIPSLSPHLRVRQEGDVAVLANAALQLPVELRGPVDELLPWLKAIDAERSVGHIAHVVGGGRPTPQQLADGLALFRHLYKCDVIELRLRHRSSPHLPRSE